MAAVQGVMSAAERSMRSVFVGNIPYEATEEQLKDIFSEVGPVVSFRLVYDRETGKPKGYGFCEYKDQETALSAMRNLNGYELNGRALRVDNAASEKSKEELKNLQASLGGPPVESPYGPEVEPEKAPEAISKAVASLPPEQMFELMKQMKSCIQNNPNEARTMLLQNPQLAYALLQAQVIMRIVDPQVVLSMLQRPNPNPNNLLNSTGNPAVPNDVPAPLGMGGMPNVSNSGPVSQLNSFGSQSAANDRAAPFVEQPFGLSGQQPPVGGLRGSVPQGPRGSLLGERPPGPSDNIRSGPVPPFGDPRAARETFDPRLDPRSAMGDRDLRQMGPPIRDRDLRPSIIPMDRDLRSNMADQDLRGISPPPRGMGDNSYEPRFRGGPPESQRPGPLSSSAPFDTHLGSGGRYEPRPSFEGRSREDPRVSQSAALGGAMRQPPVSRSTNAPNVPAQPPGRQPNIPSAGGGGVSPQDQEKAALIMQVLQLSDQQIALLPPEQRQSIMILKEQIARSAQQS